MPDPEIELPSAPIVIHARSSALSWAVAPADEQKLSAWILCRDRWLRAKQRRSGRDNTVQAYQADWHDFFHRTFSDWAGVAADGTPTYGLAPWQVGRMHAEIWVESLQDRGLANATIIRKVSALSSFYDYAMHDYTVQDPARGEIALWDHPNPFRIRDLPKPNGQPVFPSAAECQAIFDQIDLGTPAQPSATGLRNLALLAGMFATTRRVTEWTELRWGDIHEDSDGHWFTYRYKGGVTKKQKLPADIYDLIVSYLRVAGRLAAIRPDDPVFVAHADTALRFRDAQGRPTLTAAYDPAGQAISSSYVWHLLHRYGAAAGIADERKLHPHGLRHAGARYRKDLGANLWELQATLGHGNIAVTERYSRAVLETPQDAYADSIGTMLPRQLKFLFKEPR
jgi:integrase/recombinase XerC